MKVKWRRFRLAFILHVIRTWDPNTTELYTFENVSFGNVSQPKDPTVDVESYMMYKIGKSTSIYYSAEKERSYFIFKGISPFCVATDVHFGLLGGVSFGSLISAWHVICSRRFTSGTTPADLLVAMMAAKPITSTPLWPSIGSLRNSHPLCHCSQHVTRLRLYPLIKFQMPKFYASVPCYLFKLVLLIKKVPRSCPQIFRAK